MAENKEWYDYLDWYTGVNELQLYGDGYEDEEDDDDEYDESDAIPNHLKLR